MTMTWKCPILHFVEGKTQDNDFLFFSLNFDRVFGIQLQKNVLSDKWVHKEGRKKYFDSTRYNRPWVLGQGYQRWPYQGHKRLHISHVNPLARLLKQPCFGFLFFLVNSSKRLSLIVRVNVVLNRTVVVVAVVVTDFSTTCAVVIVRVTVSCITSVDGIILWLLIWGWLLEA